MKVTSSVVALALLSMACYASFAWAIRRLFHGSAKSSRMIAVQILGTAFALWQIALLGRGTVNDSRMMVAGACVVYVASLALFWSAAAVVRRSRFAIAFTNTTPNEIVTRGPYAVLRHPLYAAYTLYWLAGLLATGVVWLLLPVVTMTLFYVAAILQEEREFMNSDLADQYRDYRRRVGAMFPKL
jgi:hypothetical protein